MKILNAEQTRDADRYTIENEPISSINLMERAAGSATEKIIELYPNDVNYKIFVGPGNNGGDGLVITRLLAEKNNFAQLFIVKFTNKFSKDFEINLQRLKEQNLVDINYIESDKDLPIILPEDIVIDAILGSGLTRPLAGLPEKIVKHINVSKAEIIAIDSPSGLFCEENPSKGSTIIKAVHTLTFQNPSVSFLFPENEDYVGKFHIVDIGLNKRFIEETDSSYFLCFETDIEIKERKKFSHKGNFGHAVIFAGSYGKAGAAVLAVEAAHRTGTGLVSAAVPKCNYNILHISSAETMLIVDPSELFLSNLPDLTIYNTLAIGPGIGFEDLTTELLKDMIHSFNKPIVFDADAITILSKNKEWLNEIPPGSIFTPHPKEFERLVGKSDNDYRRLIKQKEFAQKYNCCVVLKGAYSSIVCSDEKIYFNTTGNPGMATGGSGDVLTGMIVSFLAQGYTPKESAVNGVYLHGLAGDLAAKKFGFQSLKASDIIDHIPDAYKFILQQ